MKHVLVALLLATAGSTALLTSGNPSPWSRVPDKPDLSQGAVVSQVIGANTWVTIAYHRPGVRGRDVWSARSARDEAIVPREGKPFPWRAGANECTTFTVSTDVRVEGQALAAGTYGLFMIPDNEHWTLIFNRDSEQWGSRGYDSSKDVLRMELTPRPAPFTEWLQFSFDRAEAWSARSSLRWAGLELPFEIAVEPKQG